MLLHVLNHILVALRLKPFPLGLLPCIQVCVDLRQLGLCFPLVEEFILQRRQLSMGWLPATRHSVLLSVGQQRSLAAQLELLQLGHALHVLQHFILNLPERFFALRSHFFILFHRRSCVVGSLPRLFFRDTVLGQDQLHGLLGGGLSLRVA